MRFNPKARIDESQIENREGRGGGGLGGGLGGGSGMRLPIPTGGGGRIGVGTIIVIVLYVVVQMCAGNSVVPGTGDSNSAGTGQAVAGTCRNGADANKNMDCAIDLLTNSVQAFWATALPAQANIAYQPIKTVKYTGQTSSGCGTAQSAMGPFYCPNDKRVYIDRDFMRQMLQGELGAKGGPFALGYVLAHEYGHHIEDQLGILGQMRTQQGPKSDSVRVELMADCLGGVWAKSATTTKDADGNVLISDLTADDIARAVDAARAVGDDRIQRETSGRVNEESWTHGSSAERTRWFDTGLKQGSIAACNTFKTESL
ncbi:KPN_02809 family neutral zinc metallopeptidase [Nocardioides terrisoli]|uniref:KPN_02809 family neutral zinc metallopeptidase n=1 Tax=Nocardioides terrisoli TaxID=3388267 RepID=UPI00287BA868|nr:neutral zinc metallopeptidase [Nocardioides marmorisolisilvae]